MKLPSREQCLEWAKEVGIGGAYVCGKPDECPDDDDCCHHNIRDGVWVKDGKIQAIIHRAYKEGAEAMREKAENKLEKELCNRPDDPPANYFDGGLRHGQKVIRNLKVEE